jgi:hypothetical protein
LWPWLNHNWSKRCCSDSSPEQGNAVATKFVIIGPSGVRALPFAAGMKEGGHYFRYFFSFLFLPPLFKTTEGVDVGFHIFAWAPKPLAAGINEGGHYFRYFSFFLFLPPLFKTTEGVVIGFHIFAWAPKYHKFKYSNKKKSGTPPTPQIGCLVSDWLMTSKQASLLAAGS